VIQEILADKEVIAMVAPAIEGQFGENIDMASIKATLLKLGFSDMVEVGLGGDMTAAFESVEWAEALKEGRKMTTSCCPAFINMLRKHFPDQYRDNKSTTVSPMCAISRYLKLTHPGCVTVFIGPCIAKKAESSDERIPDNADYVITFGELRALLRSRDMEFEHADGEYQQASAFGKKFASSGGVAGAVLECMKERGEDLSDIRLLKVAGGDECKKALLMLKAGRLEENFIEGMVCPGGCVGGPSKHMTEAEITKARNSLLAKADDRKILDNLREYPMSEFSMNRHGHMNEELVKKVFI
jgi:ferredoxin hydrogenase large subunit